MVKNMTYDESHEFVTTLIKMNTFVDIDQYKALLHEFTTISILLSEKYDGIYNIDIQYIMDNIEIDDSRIVTFFFNTENIPDNLKTYLMMKWSETWSKKWKY